MKQLIEIARSVREWTEREVEYEGWSDPHELWGMCAIASGRISRELTKMSIKHKLVLVDTGYGAHVHVVATLDGKEYIIDVTATQFKVPLKVIVMPHFQLIRSLTPEVMEFFFPEDILNSYKFDNVADLYKRQVDDDWPEEQLVRLEY